MLDIRHLRLIVTLAEHGSVVRAGRVLGMSASAVTRAIMAVEDRIGNPLFDRTRRGFVPTAICRAVIAKAPDLLERVDELSAIVANGGSRQADRLVLSAGPSALDTVVGPAIAMLLTRRPTAQIQVLSGSTVDAVRELRERRASVAVADVSDLDNPEELVITRMLRHPLFIVARRDHPILAIDPKLQTADIFRYPFILPSYVPARTTPGLSAAVAASKQDRGGRPFPVVVADSISASLAIAAQSDALVACTARGALPYVRAGDLVVLPWRQDWAASNFAAMHLRGPPVSKAVETLLQCLVEADEASLQVASDLNPAGMPPLRTTLSVVGHRTKPALT